MTIDAWLRAALADADHRGIPELKPLLESLAVATRALRGANFLHDPGGTPAERPPGAADSGRVDPPIPGPSSPRS